MTRHTITCIDQWVEHSVKLLQRLCEDWDDIRSTLSPEHNPGLLSSLAYLGNITGKEQYTLLSRAALVTMRRQIERIRSQITGVGLSGWGGIIYTLTHLSSLWNDRELLAEAEAIVELLPPLIEKDDELDIMGGATGCIGALLSLYQYAPSERIVEIAVKCGEHLLTRTQSMEVGVGWATINQTAPLTGFSHGAAGFAWALLKLADLTRQKRFRETALQALAYERSLFSSNAENWPDLRKPVSGIRDPNEPMFMTMWCHGAAGIGLSRIDSLKYLDDATTRAEIDTALQTTLSKGFETNHSLCHGSGCEM